MLNTQQPPGPGTDHSICPTVTLSSSESWAGSAALHRQSTWRRVRSASQVREAVAWPEALGSRRTCRTMRLRAGEQLLKWEGEPSSPPQILKCQSVPPSAQQTEGKQGLNLPSPHWVSQSWETALPSLFKLLCMLYISYRFH